MRWFEVIFVVHTLGIIFVVEAKSYLEDLTLNERERQSLDEFKERVSGKLPHDYMKEDVYLIRWLRGRFFDIPRAEKFLMDNVRWREENRIDTIHSEDWSEFLNDYKYSLKSRTKDGKVTLYGHMGRWNFRKTAVSGKSQRFYRYFDKIIDETYNLIREESEKYKNTSQGMLILNLSGFNLVEHACLQCAPVILRLLYECENHYPGIADRLIMVNVPGPGEAIIGIARPTLSPLTNQILEVYGTNKRVWQKALFTDYTPDQLPTELGGTMVDDDQGYDYD